MPQAVSDLEDFRRFAERLADAARAESLPRFRTGELVDNKLADAEFDPVTDADREAERAQRALIAAAYPDHGVIGEEFPAHRPDASWRWVLDPVDGTRAFICGATSWTTLIALERDASPVLGVIDQPFTEERWIGMGSQTVYASRAGRRTCRTSGVTALGEARVSTTDPRGGECFTHEEAAAFAGLAGAARVARFSLDAYAYGLLALGEVDLVVESGLKRHDFAALVPVVEGAGGVITGWSGEPLGDDPRGRVVAAAGGALHAEALARLGGL